MLMNRFHTHLAQSVIDCAAAIAMLHLAASLVFLVQRKGTLVLRLDHAKNYLTRCLLRRHNYRLIE